MINLIPKFKFVFSILKISHLIADKSQAYDMRRKLYFMKFDKKSLRANSHWLNISKLYEAFIKSF